MTEQTTVTVGEVVKFQCESVSAERSSRWLAEVVSLSARVIDHKEGDSFLVHYLLPVGQRLLEASGITVPESELRCMCSEVLQSVSTVTVTVSVTVGDCAAGALMHSEASSSSHTIFVQRSWFDRATNGFDPHSDESSLCLVVGVSQLLCEVLHLLTPALLLFEAEAHRLQELGEDISFAGKTVAALAGEEPKNKKMRGNDAKVPSKVGLKTITPLSRSGINPTTGDLGFAFEEVMFGGKRMYMKVDEKTWKPQGLCFQTVGEVSAPPRDSHFSNQLGVRCVSIHTYNMNHWEKYASDVVECLRQTPFEFQRMVEVWRVLGDLQLDESASSDCVFITLTDNVRAEKDVTLKSFTHVIDSAVMMEDEEDTNQSAEEAIFDLAMIRHKASLPYRKS